MLAKGSLRRDMLEEEIEFVQADTKHCDNEERGSPEPSIQSVSSDMAKQVKFKLFQDSESETFRNY